MILPILLQTLMGYSPVEAGLAMAPRGLGTLVMTPSAAPFPPLPICLPL